MHQTSRWLSTSPSGSVGVCGLSALCCVLSVRTLRWSFIGRDCKISGTRLKTLRRLCTSPGDESYHCTIVHPLTVAMSGDLYL